MLMVGIFCHSTKTSGQYNKQIRIQIRARNPFNFAVFIHLAKPIFFNSISRHVARAAP